MVPKVPALTDSTVIPPGLGSRPSSTREIWNTSCIFVTPRDTFGTLNPRHAFHYTSCPAASTEKMSIPQRPCQQELHGFQWAMTLVWLSRSPGFRCIGTAMPSNSCSGLRCHGNLVLRCSDRCFRCGRRDAINSVGLRISILARCFRCEWRLLPSNVSISTTFYANIVRGGVLPCRGIQQE